MMSSISMIAELTNDVIRESSFRSVSKHVSSLVVKFLQKWQKNL
jgi:hypothetical protein